MGENRVVNELNNDLDSFNAQFPKQRFNILYNGTRSCKEVHLKCFSTSASKFVRTNY